MSGVDLGEDADVPQPVADRSLERRRGDDVIQLRHVGDQVDIVFVAADRLDRGADGRGPLEIDRDGADEQILGIGQPTPDSLVAALRELELAVGQFQPLAHSLENADKLHVLHHRPLIGVHLIFSYLFPDSRPPGAQVYRRTAVPL